MYIVGNSIPEILHGVLDLFPLDTYVLAPVSFITSLSFQLHYNTYVQVQCFVLWNKCDFNTCQCARDLFANFIEHRPLEFRQESIKDSIVCLGTRLEYKKIYGLACTMFCPKNLDRKDSSAD